MTSADLKALLRQAIADFIEPMILSHLTKDTEWRTEADKFVRACAPFVFGPEESVFGVKTKTQVCLEASEACGDSIRDRSGALFTCTLRAGHGGLHERYVGGQIEAAWAGTTSPQGRPADRSKTRDAKVTGLEQRVRVLRLELRRKNRKVVELSTRVGELGMALRSCSAVARRGKLEDVVKTANEALGVPSDAASYALGWRKAVTHAVNMYRRLAKRQGGVDERIASSLESMKSWVSKVPQASEIAGGFSGGRVERSRSGSLESYDIGSAYPTDAKGKEAPALVGDLLCFLPEGCAVEDLVIVRALDEPQPCELTELLVTALAPLVAIANAYDANNLDDEARKRWGKNLEHENTTTPDQIEIYSGRGGQELLTLAHCFEARKLVERWTKRERAR